VRSRVPARNATGPSYVKSGRARLAAVDQEPHAASFRNPKLLAPRPTVFASTPRPAKTAPLTCADNGEWKT